MSMLDYFAYNPLQKRRLDPIQQGEGESPGEPYIYWGPSDAMFEQDPWRARNWQTQGNFEVLDADETTGAYKVRVKSGDKEGTIYQLTPDDKGGYRSQELGKEKWDTNQSLFKDPQFRKFLAIAGAMAGGAYLGSLSSGSAAASGSGLGSAGSSLGSAAGSAVGLSDSALLSAALGPEGAALTQTALGTSGLSNSAIMSAALGTEGAALAQLAASPVVGSSSLLGTLGSVGKAVWDVVSTPVGAQIAGGALKLAAGLYADKKAEKAYNQAVELVNRKEQEKLERRKKNQDVSGIRIPPIGGGLMSTRVNVPEFDPYRKVSR